MKNAKIFFLTQIIFLILVADYARAGDPSLRVQPKSVNMGIVTADDYRAGYQEKIQANLLTVKDNENDWKVMIKTYDSSMGVVGSYAKSVSDLEWRAQGAYAAQTTYIGLANYDIEVARGPKDNNDRSVFIDYRVLLSWAKDVPGNYYITLLYTLTTQ